MRDLSNNLLGSFVFQRMALGGGGQTVSPKFSDDGTMVVRTDTDQGFFRGPSDTEWTPMLRMGDNVNYASGGASEPKLDYGYAGGGTLDTAIHMTNSDRQACIFGGYVWLTDDSWITPVKASLAQAAIGGNGVPHSASRLEFDAGEDILIYCDPIVGLRYTLDGGANFTTVASVPTPTTGGGYYLFVAIDRSSSVVSGQHQIVYAWSYGNGLYRSTTGIDGTFSLIADQPTDLDIYVRDMKVGPTGVLWITRIIIAGDPPTVFPDTALKWTVGGGWAVITGSTADAGAWTAVPDLDDEDRCILIGQSGAVLGVVDGATVDRYGSGDAAAIVRVAPDIPWLAWTNEDFFANGGGAFDPTDHTRMVVGNGIGVWEGFNILPNTGLNAAQTWTSITLGIDQLCTMEHKTTPLDDVICAFLDRANFVLNANTPDRFPLKHGPSRGAGFQQHSQGIDWAGDDPSFLVGVMTFTYPYNYYSPDRGVTWIAGADAGGPVGGNIATSTKLNSVWFGTQNTGCEYTTDGCATWATCLFDGDPIPATTIDSVSYQRQCVVADKDNPGHFYCFLWGVGGVTDGGGVWKSTNGGAAWTRQHDGYITGAGRDFFNCKLRILPRGAGQTPHLFWVIGDESGAGESTISTINVWMSIDGGVTWLVVPLLDEIHDLAFGKAFLEHSYPALYVNGWVDGTLATYVCKDFDPSDRTGTWEVAALYPGGSCDVGWTLSASMNSHRVHVGHGGSGLKAGGHRWRIKAKAA